MYLIELIKYEKRWTVLIDLLSFFQELKGIIINESEDVCESPGACTEYTAVHEKSYSYKSE